MRLNPMQSPGRAWLLTTFFAFGLLLTLPAYAAPPKGYEFLPYDSALAKAGSQDKPLFLYFGRFGCSTCRKMHQEVFSDQALRRRYNDHYVLAYVDTESGNRITLPSGERITEMQFASRMRILGTPTFYFMNADEKPLVKLAGFKDVEQMKAYDDYIYGNHYQAQSFKQFTSNR